MNILNCERCTSPKAVNRSIMVLLDYGWGNGVRREEVVYTLCDRCGALACQMQPVDLEQFFDYRPRDVNA